MMLRAIWKSLNVQNQAYLAMRNQRDEARAEVIELQRQLCVVHRQVASLAGHPCARNGWLSGTEFIVGGRTIGGDDPSLAGLRRQK